MNIYSINNKPNKLSLGVDINSILSINNHEFNLLIDILTSSINRRFNGYYSHLEVRDLLQSKIAFPLMATTFILEISKTTTIQLSVQSFAIPTTSFNFNNSLN